MKENALRNARVIPLHLPWLALLGLLGVRLLSGLRVRQLSDSVTTCNYAHFPFMEVTHGPGRGQSGEAYGAV